MRKYAIISNDKVINTLNLTDEQYADASRCNQLVVDIEDMIPQPEAGWILEGNKLVLHTENMSADDLDLLQQKAQRQYGLYLLPIAVDRIGARNLKLARENTPANITTLASQMSSIKILLEAGALKTVRIVINSIKDSHPNHIDILEDVVASITNFLVSNGYE